MISSSGNRTSENAAHAPGNDFEYKDHFRQIELSYEIDAWGRVRLSLEAGKADLAATETDQQVVQLTSYLDVVDAQRAALQAERQETQLRGQLSLDNSARESAGSARTRRNSPNPTDNPTCNDPGELGHPTARVDQLHLSDQFRCVDEPK